MSESARLGVLCHTRVLYLEYAHFVKFSQAEGRKEGGKRVRFVPAVGS